jgi:uncharacterized membrane protein
MKIVRIIVPLAFVVFLIGYTKELRHLMNEGGWPELAVVLICFGGIFMCYGVALMPITSKVRARVSRASVTVGYLCGEVFWWVSVGLVILAGRYSVFLGVAVFLCCTPFTSQPENPWD